MSDKILHGMPSNLYMQKPAHLWDSFLYFFLPWEARSHHSHSSVFANLRLQLRGYFILFCFIFQTHFPSAGETSDVRRNMSSLYVCLLDTELLHVSPLSETLSGTAEEVPLNMSPLGNASRTRDCTQAAGTG